MNSFARFSLVGVCLLSLGLQGGFAQAIHLNAGDIDTSQAVPATSARALAAATTGSQLHLVQFDGPIQPEWVAQLEQDGYRIVNYIPDNAYLVYGGSTALKSLRSAANPHLQWEGAYVASDKINPRAQPAAVAARRAATGTAVQFAVQLVQDAAANAETIALLDSLKLQPFNSISTNESLRLVNLVVELPADSLEQVAARADVISVNTHELPHRLCERQAQIVAGNLNGDGSQPSGVGYYSWLLSKGFTQTQFDTSGFIVDIADDGWDRGVAATPANREFRKYGDAAQVSRMKYSHTASTMSSTDSHGADGHGNINISIVGGFSTNSGSPYVDTNGYHRGQGICPFANLGNTKVFADGGTWDPTDAQEAAFIASNYTSGVRISSDSWGNTGDGSYDVSSQNYDTWTRDSQPAVSGNQQVLYVFAAGNDGSGASTIGPPGSGKNIISVGAAENYNMFGTDGCSVTDSGADNANDIIDFSSRGPCTDGRKKPDIVAPGTHVQGAASFATNYNGSGVCDQYQPAGQTNYAASSGTSHSTPAVAGGSALVYQYFINQGWSTSPSPAMVKAYLMNAARYMNGVDTGDTLPSNNQGMGCMNLGTAFDGVARILRDQLTNDLFTASGQSRKFYGMVSDTNKPVRITLGWTDAPGSTTGNAYNNDLNLVVTVGGVAYKGNVFSGAYSASGGTADAKNNVESVFLPAGATGLVQIAVSGYNINSDGVPNYGGSLDQDFALVVANATAYTPSNYPPALDPVGDKTIATNRLMQFTVTASDPVDGDSVRLWADGIPAWATFAGATNAATASCQFSGTTPAVTGTYAVTFYAADKDGTNSEAITITVNDINCVPTNILTETFDASTSVPAGWVDGGTANDTASHYQSSPNCRALGTGDTLQTPTVNYPTQIVFYVDASSSGSGQTASLDYKVGAGDWTQLGTFIVSTTGGTQTFDLSSAPNLAEATDVSFRFNSTFNTWYLDNVVINGFNCGGGAAVNHAPVISVAGGTNQSVGVNSLLSFVVTVSDSDVESVGVFTNAAPAGASFPEATGTAPIQSTFTWTPTVTGAYAATFVAYDALVAVTQTVAITVTEPVPELLAPVIQAASDVLANQFNANWLASSNATGYYLDVATNAGFTSGGGASLTNLSEDFSLYTHTNGATDVSTNLDAYMHTAGWTGAKAYENAGTAKMGSSSAKGYLTTPTVDLSANGGVATLTFDLGQYGTDVGAVQVMHAPDGSTFTQVGGDITPPAALTTQTIEITGGTALSKIQITASGLSKNRFYLDNFQITQSAAARRYVPGYQGRDVGNVTTFAVTGLTESVTYYYRAKAYNVSSNSAYSGTTNVTTAAGVNVPPVLGAIGGKSVGVGSNLQFQVAATPTDGDTVTLTASNLPAGATFNATNENGTFQWLSASPTGVYTVTFYATDKDGSDSEAVAITVNSGSTELLAPVIQAASSIQATQFNANWLSSANATGYRLDVATNAAFRHGVVRRAATLSAGDLMIVTVNADTNGTNKGFDAVPLVDLDAGTVIYFTDNGWTNGVWRTGEGIVTYTAPGAITAGTVLSYRSATANGFVYNANFSLSTSGDNILAYQGSTNSPQFLCGVGWASAAPWIASGAVTANNSMIPSGLSTDTYTIVSLGNLDNYQYSSANGTTGSKAALLQLVGTPANWASSDTSTYAKFTPDFTIGAGETVNDYVPGYENRDVADVTTYAVTGLTEGVTYYYRVLAYNVSSNSGYSAVTSVVTAAASGTPPVLGAIGDQSVFLGETLQFQVSATPTEADAVTLTASNLPAGAAFYPTNQNGTFLWTSASPTGLFSVTFNAADKDGGDAETIGITVYPLPDMGAFTMTIGSPASATLPSVAGQTYQMQFSSNIWEFPVLWSNVDSKVGTGGSITLTDTNTLIDIKRYYRVVIP